MTPLPPDRTEELEKKLRATIGKGPEDYKRRDWISLREGFRLRLLYPKQYVAFRDHHQGTGAQRRLISREVVYVSPQLEEVRQHIDRLPDEQLQGIFIEFVPGEQARSAPPRGTNGR